MGESVGSAPISRLLKVAENEASAQDVQAFANWGAKLGILGNADLS